jgi:hypothetical protein
VKVSVRALAYAAWTCATLSSPSAQPATNIKELRSHFAACFEPPRELDGSRLTFYFSLTTDAGIIGGQPRTVWFGLQASGKERRQLLARASSTLVSDCFPVSLNREMARLIPGDVLFLQFEGAEQATRVYLEPYGSHVSPDYWTYRRW